MRINTYKDSVTELQEALLELFYAGYPIESVVPDGTYDEQTRLSVTQFQEYIGLTKNGIVDVDTWNAVFTEYRKVIYDQRPPAGVIVFPNERGYTVKRGTVSDVVLVTQIMLKDISAHLKDSFNNLSGEYDEETQIAVTEFQRISALPETGVVDKRTWNHLTNFYNKNNRGF